MALRFSNITLPVDGGLDEKTSTFFKNPPSAEELTNVAFDKNGDIRCRPGFSSLGGSQWDSLRFVVSGSDKMLGIDASNARSFKEPTTWNNYQGSNYVIPVDYRKLDILREGSWGSSQNEKVVSVRGADHTLCLVSSLNPGFGYSLKAIAYRNDNGKIDLVSDITSGAYNYHAAVSQNGLRFGVTHTNAVGGFVFTKIYVPTSLVSNTTHSTAVIPNANPVSSCCGIGGSDMLAIATAGTTVYTFSMDDSGTVAEGTVALTFGSGTADLIDVCTYDESGPSQVDGYVLVAGRSASGNYEWHELDTSLTILSSYTGAGLASSGDLQVTVSQQYDKNDTGDYFIAHSDANNVVSILEANETGPGAGTPRQIPSSRILSKMFKHPSIDRTLIAIAPIQKDPGYEGSKLCVIEKFSGSTNGFGVTPVCTFAVYNGSEPTVRWVTQANVYDGIACIGTGKTLHGKTATERHLFDFSPAFLAKANYGSNIYFGGGDLHYFDGTRIGIYHLNNTPNLSSSITKTGAASGSYSMRVVAFFKDVNGKIHMTPPSNTVTASLGATANSYTVDVSPIHYALSDIPANDVGFLLYRTDNGGSVFYLSNRVTRSSYNTTTTGRYTIIETSPGTLAGNAILAAQSELAPSVVPAPYDMASFDGRLWMIPAENRTEVWYTKTSSIEHESDWSSLLRLNVGPDSELVRMASVDDKIVLFTEDSAYAVYGKGPGNNGAGPNYGLQKLAIGVGCANPNSVVSGPFGIIFLANSGFWKIDRAMQPTLIGAKVEGLEGTVTSAVLDTKRNEVVFGQTTGALVYNYLFEKWSAWDEIEINDLAIFDDKLVFVDADAATNGIDIGRFSDSGTTAGNYDIPTLTYTTPWIALAGLQGVKRVRRIQMLFEELDVNYDGDITVTSYYDYDTSASDTETFSGATWSALDYPRQVEYEMPIQDVESFRLKIELAPSATLRPGLALTSLRVDVAKKRGQYGLPAGARA